MKKQAPIAIEIEVLARRSGSPGSASLRKGRVQRSDDEFNVKPLRRWQRLRRHGRRTSLRSSHEVRIFAASADRPASRQGEQHRTAVASVSFFGASRAR